MKVSIFFLIAVLFVITVPAQNRSGNYYPATNQVETTYFYPEANETGKLTYFINRFHNRGIERISAGPASAGKDKKGYSFSGGSRADNCKCAGCAFFIDTRIAIPKELKRTDKTMDKGGLYPEGSAYGQLLKELTMKWM